MMVDDLVTLGVTEPYRMFTSRAEYRLFLRADNADQRLTSKGAEIGLVGDARLQRHRKKMEELKRVHEELQDLVATTRMLEGVGLAVNGDGQRRSAWTLLSYPNVNLDTLRGIWPELSGVSLDVAELLENDARYDGYLRRQEADVRAFRRDESLGIPQDLDFSGVPGLSTEIRNKLSEARPATLGSAARISGVTPAALTALLRYVRRNGQYGAKEAGSPS